MNEQQALDAATHALMLRFSQEGIYREVMDEIEAKKPGISGVVEESLERHAARQRAAGRKGW